MDSRPEPKRRWPARGFTLVELMIVMVIIGILMAFILTASMNSLRSAQAQATLGLIAKLDSGLADRVEALLHTRPVPTEGHQRFASIWTGTQILRSPQRAQVVAIFDMLKAELPDVFYVPVSTDADYSAGGVYRINFAAKAWNGSGAGDYAYGLPIRDLTAIPPGQSFATDPFVQVTGIYGASFTVAGGLFKNLGNVPQEYMPSGPSGTDGLIPFDPKGYDGADNGGNGLVDEFAEGLTAANTAAVNQSLALHTHKTARAEMLYAILVESQGPFGSVFDGDDFTDQQVRDTDHDGLPEFVDAWGEPLQFYRWPIFYHSDLQRGVDLLNSPNGPYSSVYEPREKDPLDPNQLLVAPGWWSNSAGNNTSFPTGYLPSTASTGGAPISGGVLAFHTYFHGLVEPLASTNTNATANAQYFWDRTGNVSALGARRAFNTKFLIVSAGVDNELGIARFDVFNPGVSPNAQSLVIEGQARQTDLNVGNAAYFYPITPGWTYPSGNTLIEAGQDDITNHNLQAAGGGGLQ